MRTRAPVLLGFVLAFVSHVQAGDPAAGYTDSVVATSLSTPTAIAFLPDGRLLITEKNGALRLKGAGPVATLATIPVCSGSEMGLLGIAIDPAFDTNGFIYLYRTENTGGCGSASGRSNEVIRVTMGPGDTVNLASLSVLLTGMRTDNGNHDGGALRIGPDQKLYVGVGDTGNGDNQGCPGSSTNPYSQSLAALEGKILRLELDGTVPGDNPFVGTVGARGEIFAYGFRNPFRMGFHPVTNELWVADVGDLAFEEIDIVTAGKDYGWPHCEATFPTGCEQVGDVDPIFVYSHGGGCPGEGSFPSLGTSITGGSFAGAAFSDLSGAYVFGDYTGSTVYLATVNGAGDAIGTPSAIVTNAAGPVDVITGPDGAVYYVAIDTGDVHRVARGAVTPTQPLSGKKLLLTVNADPGRNRLLTIAADSLIDLGTGNGGADDPVLNGGSLRLRTTAGCPGGVGCDVSIALPQSPPTSTWSYLGPAGSNRGYRFRRDDATGSVRITIKAGRLVKVKVTGVTGLGLEADPAPVDTNLSIGGHTYCTQFGVTQDFQPNKVFKAKNAAAPASCLP